MFSFARLLSRILLVGMILGLATAWASPATEQITATIEKVIALVRDPGLAGEERRQKLREAIYERFDFEKMSMGSVGPKWREFTPAQKEQFVGLFKQILENSYLDKIESYQGESFKFSKEIVKSEKFIDVHGVVVAKGREFQLAYTMTPKSPGAANSEWVVYDVNIEGISLVGNYRSQFDQMWQKSSIDEVIAKLGEKIKNKDSDALKGLKTP